MTRPRSTAREEVLDLRPCGDRRSAGSGLFPGPPSRGPDPTHCDGPNGQASSRAVQSACDERTGQRADPHAAHGSAPRILFDMRVVTWRLGIAAAGSVACLAFAFDRTGMMAVLPALFGLLLARETALAHRALQRLRRRYALLSLVRDPTSRCASRLDEVMLLIQLAGQDAKEKV